MSELTKIITASDPKIRNRALDAFCRAASLPQLLAECDALDQFRRQSDNLYEQVRALFFLYAIYRFHLPLKPDMPSKGLIPFEGYTNLLKRRFEEAIEIFLASQAACGDSDSASMVISTEAGAAPASCAVVRNNSHIAEKTTTASGPSRDIETDSGKPLARTSNA